MKTFQALLLITFLIINGTMAQVGIKLNEGQQLEMVTNSWVNTLIADKKFRKNGPEARAKMVNEFNADILKGKIKGFGGAPYMMTVSNLSGTGDSGEFFYTMGPYKFRVTCKNDTMLLFRNEGLMRAELNIPVNLGNPAVYSDSRESFEWTKKTIGIGVQGVAIFPNNLKVGDKLPTYEDFMLSVPQSWNDEVKLKVVSGMKKVTSTERGYVMGIDSRDGQFKSGLGTKTTTQYERTYKTIKEEAQVTISSSIYILHHLFATVTGIESLKVGKETYEAYVIQSQKWVRGSEFSDYETGNEKFNSIIDEAERQFGEIVNKRMTKKGIINEQGFTVDHVTEWFVPGIGVVKMETVDSHGVITARTNTLKIK